MFNICLTIQGRNAQLLFFFPVGKILHSHTATLSDKISHNAHLVKHLSQHSMLNTSPSLSVTHGNALAGPNMAGSRQVPFAAVWSPRSGRPCHAALG
jgi:hypothetical protein